MFPEPFLSVSPEQVQGYLLPSSQIAGNEVLLRHDFRDEDEEWQARRAFRVALVLCGVIFVVVVVSRQGEEWCSEKGTHTCFQKLCWCGDVNTRRSSANSSRVRGVMA